MTDRQATILQAIVEHYVKDANPVGSQTLSQYFNVSPATIRAEMAALEEEGYITHPHTSAGRLPTDLGYRFYVNNLKKREPGADSRMAHVLEQRIASAGEPEQAIRSAVHSLMETTHSLAMASAGPQLYMRGLSNLLTQPEFGDVARIHSLAQLLDNIEPWLREISPTQKVSVYIGSENPIGKSSGASMVISRFRSPISEYNYVGVVGPTRQSYGRVISLVSFAAKTLEEELNDKLR
ncbi:MAG: HTH domain-containing protein [Candidatus Saccharimonadales bacterium]